MTINKNNDSLASTNTHQPTKKIWGWLVLLVITILVVGVTFVIRHNNKSAQDATARKFDQKSRPIPVLAALAVNRDMNVYLEALGTVASRNTVIVRTRVNGQLMKLYFREGQTVKAGDLLAEVDPRPYEVQLAQMEAQLTKDKATLNNNEVDLQRYKTLLAQDSIASQQVDTQEALVRQTRATVAADQAQVDNAKLQLSYCRTPALFGGVVGLRQVDPGNQIQTTDAAGIVTITQMQPITVLFPIPEDNLPTVIKRMQAGGEVRVEAFDRGKTIKLAEGKLLTLDNQIDTTTGTIKLRAEFKNDQNTLFPNQFVNIRMLVDTQKNAIVVPTAAVQSGSKGSNVYVVKSDDSVELRPIKTGVAEGDYIVVSNGLASGESVVVDGADKLRDGAKVKPIVPDASDKPKHQGQSGEGKHHHRGDA